MESFSLVADLMYVSQNAPRICRAAFEICLRRGWPAAAELILTLCKVSGRCTACTLCMLQDKKNYKAGGTNSQHGVRLTGWLGGDCAAQPVRR